MIPEKMKAVVVTGVHEAQIHEYNVPEYGDDQLLIKVMRSSICTIDQRPYDGKVKSYFPRVGGHEGAGTVVAVGKNVKGYAVGDNVTVGRIHCMTCQNCILGLGHCVNGPNFGKPAVEPTIDTPMNLQGCFSQYIVRKPTEVFKFPAEVNFEYACITEPLSDVVHSIRRSRLAMGETCVIIGAGIMGIIHIQVAKRVGARVIMAEMDPQRREKALKAGADFVVDPANEDIGEFVSKVTEGRGVDVVFYSIASSKFFDQYYKLLAVPGRIVIYSNQIPDEPVPIKLGNLHTYEYEIIGTVGSVDRDFLLAIKLMQSGAVDMSQVIEGTYALSDCKKAYDDACLPNTYRCVIRMDEEGETE
ncbi:MAG: zinc-binding dehydrogenase [Lachnospiraceae bacterium]|nr:zinc-binding dehydrogenase [Lachnospiraceae bacterium]